MTCEGCTADASKLWLEKADGTKIAELPFSEWYKAADWMPSKASTLGASFYIWQVEDFSADEESGKCREAPVDATEGGSGVPACEEEAPCQFYVRLTISIYSEFDGNIPLSAYGGQRVEVKLNTGLASEKSIDTRDESSGGQAVPGSRRIDRTYDVVDDTTTFRERVLCLLSIPVGCGADAGYTISRSDIKHYPDSVTPTPTTESAASQTEAGGKLNNKIEFGFNCQPCGHAGAGNNDSTDTDFTAAQLDLWDETRGSYNSDDLISLTNVRDRSSTEIDDVVGRDAARGVTDLWPVYAQAEFDITNRQHVEVAKRAVIALLWSRGGTAATIAKVEWDEVFGDQGMIAKLRNTGARARPAPRSNSGVQQSLEVENGRRVRGWSDRDSLPINYLPLRRTAND